MSTVVPINKSVEFEIQSQNSSFEFMNSFGCILKEGVIIHQYNSKIPIQYDSIRKIFIKKRKMLIWNYGLGMLGLFFGSLFIGLSLNLIQMISISTVSMFFLISAFVFRKNQYVLIILNQSPSFTEIIIKNHFKSDAKVLVKKVNSKLKKLNVYQS